MGIDHELPAGADEAPRRSEGHVRDAPLEQARRLGDQRAVVGRAAHAHRALAPLEDAVGAPQVGERRRVRRGAAGAPQIGHDLQAGHAAALVEQAPGLVLVEVVAPVGPQQGVPAGRPGGVLPLRPADALRLPARAQGQTLGGLRQVAPGPALRRQRHLGPLEKRLVEVDGVVGHQVGPGVELPLPGERGRHRDGEQLRLRHQERRPRPVLVDRQQRPPEGHRLGPRLVVEHELDGLPGGHQGDELGEVGLQPRRDVDLEAHVGEAPLHEGGDPLAVGLDLLVGDEDELAAGLLQGGLAGRVGLPPPRVAQAAGRERRHAPPAAAPPASAPAAARRVVRPPTTRAAISHLPGQTGSTLRCRQHTPPRPPPHPADTGRGPPLPGAPGRPRSPPPQDEARRTSTWSCSPGFASQWNRVTALS